MILSEGNKKREASCSTVSVLGLNALISFTSKELGGSKLTYQEKTMSHTILHCVYCHSKDHYQERNIGTAVIHNEARTNVFNSHRISPT